MNKKLIMISGVSGTGKSASLQNLRDPEGVMYLNCEAGKELPFPDKFNKYIITDPLQVPEAFDHAEGNKDIHTIVVDGTNFLMDMFESLYIVGSSNGMQGWQNYQQFFKNLMQQNVANSTKHVIFTAHTLAILNEQEMAMEVKIPIKGALKSSSIEAFFSTVVSTKAKALVDLSDYGSQYLNINEDDELIGLKYCFQTRLTKETINERIRSPISMFSIPETFIDNDVQQVMDILDDFYN